MSVTNIKKDNLKNDLKYFNSRSLFRIQISRILFLIISIYIYSFVNSLENDEPVDVSERLVESVYFKGKKVNKISYEDIEKIPNEKINLQKAEKAKNEENEAALSSCQMFLGFWSPFKENDIETQEKHLYKAYPFFAKIPKTQPDKNFIKTSSFYFLSKKTIPLYFSQSNSFKLLGKDIFDEVMKEKFKNGNKKEKIKTEIIFENNLFSFYNNKTNLKLYNYDLNKLIDDKIISNIQGYKFWKELIMINKKKINPEFIKKSFSLIRKILYEIFSENFHIEKKQKKSDEKYEYHNSNEANSNYNAYTNFEENIEEGYIFNIFPTKSTGYCLIAIVVFFLNYNFTLYFNNKTNLPIYNFSFSIASLIACEIFYANKIYFTSSIFLLEFVFNLKNFLFSLLNVIEIETEDYNILDAFAKCESVLIFFYQLVNLLICLFLYGLYIFYRYKYAFNYFAFYYFLLQTPCIFTKNFDYLIPSIFRPFRYFFIILSGIVNFFIINYGKNKAYHLNISNNELFNHIEQDSFYIIGDLYTFFCFTYIFDYLFIQANKISSLFKDIESTCQVNRENIDKNITKIVKNYKEKIRDFGLEDSLWGISLIFGLIIQFTGIRYQKFVLFYISYYYFRMVLGVYGKVFKTKCIKVSFSILIFFFVITNFIMATKTDSKLFNLIHIKNQIKDYNDIFQLVCRMLGTSCIMGLLYQNHDFFTMEFYYLFIKKRSFKKKKKQRIEETETTDEDFNELLKDENIDKFLNELKDKYKSNSKGFFEFLLDDQESVEDMFFRDLETLDGSKTAEEIEEILEERMRNKYYRDLAKIVIVTRLVNNKANKLNDLNDNDEEFYEEDEDPIIDSENLDDINVNQNEEKNEENNQVVKNEGSRKRIFYDFALFGIDLIFSYSTLALILLFITHIDKNNITSYGYYLLNFLLLIKVNK